MNASYDGKSQKYSWTIGNKNYLIVTMSLLQPIVTTISILLFFLFVRAYAFQGKTDIPCTTIYKIQEEELPYTRQYQDFLIQADPWTETHPREIMRHPVLETIKELHY